MGMPTWKPVIWKHLKVELERASITTVATVQTIQGEAVNLDWILYS